MLHISPTLPAAQQALILAGFEWNGNLLSSKHHFTYSAMGIVFRDSLVDSFTAKYINSKDRPSSATYTTSPILKVASE